MKIQISKEEKVELLEALKSGILDTSKIPLIFSKINKCNAFEELMKELPDDPETN